MFLREIGRPRVAFPGRGRAQKPCRRFVGFNKTSGFGIEQVEPTLRPGPAPPPARTAPFRPRARVLPSPSPQLSARERILALSGALVDREPARVVRLDPAAAADELLSQLRAWGYL